MHKILGILIGLVFFVPCNAQEAASEYLRDARNYMASGEYKAAVIQLKNLLQEVPQNSEARVLLGTAYVQLGDGESAIKEFQRVKELGASRELWIVPLARAYLLAGKPRELLEEIHPDSGVSPTVQADIYANLAMAELAVKNIGAAEKNIAKAFEIDDESVEVLLAAARIAGAKQDFAQAGKFARQALDIRNDLADAWLILGEVNRAEGDHKAAIGNFDKALAVNPNFLPAKLARAAAYIGVRDFDAAEKDLDQVRKTAGDVPMALYLQGAIDFEQKAYADAESSLNKVVSVIPDHWPSLLLLGTIAYYNNQLESAYAQLSRYVNGVPGYLPAIKLLAATSLRLRQFREAIEILEPARAEAPDDPQLLALLGSAYIEQGNYDKATELLSKAAEIAPDAAAIRTQLALSYLGTGSFDQAVGELQTAVDLGKDLSQADVMLVLTLIRQKKFDAAIEHGLKLLAKQPENPVSANLLGAAYYGKGDEDSARKYWTSALDIQPGFIAAAANLAKLEIAKKNYDAAANWYQQILKQHSGNINALLGLVELARMQKNNQEMRRWMDLALKENPDDIQHRLVLADYLVSQRDLTGAKKLIDELKSNHPDDLQVMAKFGMMQFLAGEYESAVATFQGLVDKHPENPELRYLLGQSLLKAGSNEKAKQEWEQVLNSNSDYFPAAVSLVQLASNAKQYDEAIKISRELQTKYPKRAIGFQLEGDVMRARDDQANALTAYRKGFAIEAQSALAQQIFQAARATGDRSGAYGSMLEWLDKNPDDAGSRIMLGMAYIEDGEQNQAIRVYEQLIEKQPDNLLVLNNLAWLYQQKADPRAVELAERTIGLDPKDAEVIDTVGWILMLNGQIERSLPLLQKAAEQAPGIDAIQLHYAQALAKAGRNAEAREQLTKLLAGDRAFPERAEAEELLKSI
ncbi:MAG: PEP-CTERM system TPR-repeat protein PrsT [Methylococcaceae bacterium]|nr:PEP-CTERM system TPR-repeat protein PrsT [Methylococcaceae bacterium]